MLLKSLWENVIHSYPSQLADAMENCLLGGTLQFFNVLNNSRERCRITRLVWRYCYLIGATMEWLWLSLKVPTIHSFVSETWFIQMNTSHPHLISLINHTHPHPHLISSYRLFLNYYYENNPPRQHTKCLMVILSFTTFVVPMTENPSFAKYSKYIYFASS